MAATVSSVAAKFHVRRAPLRGDVVWRAQPLTAHNVLSLSAAPFSPFEPCWTPCACPTLRAARAFAIATSVIVARSHLRVSKSFRARADGSSSGGEGCGSSAAAGSQQAEAASIASKSGIRFEQPPRAVVVGGGPCGALASTVLANHGFAVDVFERDGREKETVAKGEKKKEEERAVEEEEKYTFPLALSERATKALKVGGAQLPEGAALMTGSFRHKNDKVTYMPTIVEVHFVERNWLASGLREQAREHPSGRVNVHCGWRLKSVDADCTCATFERVHSGHADVGGATAAPSAAAAPATAGSEWREEKFDLIIAADGVSSMARSEALRHDPTLEVSQQESDSLWEYRRLPKVPLTALDDPSLVGMNKGESKQSTHFHSKKGGKTRLLVVPLRRAGYATGLWYCLEGKEDDRAGAGQGKQSTLMSQLESADEVETVFREDHPKFFKAFTDGRADFSQALAKQPVGRDSIGTWCNRLHWKRMVLLGDAGHSMSSSLALGCNSALEDCAVLDKVLTDHFSVHKVSPAVAIAALPDALQRYTAARLADAHAATHLSNDRPLPFVATKPLAKARGFLRLFMYMLAMKVPGLEKEAKRRLSILSLDVPFTEVRRIVKQDEALAVALAGAFVVAATAGIAAVL